MTAQRDYYNTNGEHDDTLNQSRRRAADQQQQVLSLFKHRPQSLLAPHEVHALVAQPGTPLTSIRRAITNLTEAGLLEKTPHRRMGAYGKHVYCWRLRPEPVTAAELPAIQQPALF
jgi:Fe2+ or Zn2+ uptake regulation protein